MTENTDTTEMFIERVREYPILYDLKNTGYKNLRKKDKIWDTIGPLFGIEGDAAKKKWKNLRDTYAKYLKSIKTTTGQAAKKNYGNWQWAEQMEFLKPYLKFAITINNIDDCVGQRDAQNVSVDESESESITQTFISHSDIISEQSISVSNTSAAGKSSLGSDDSLTQKQKNKDTPVNQVLEYFKTKPQKRSQMDDLEHIFLGYAKSVRKLSPRGQIIVKMKLAKIITEQELSEIDANTHVMSPSDSSHSSNFTDHTIYFSPSPANTPSNNTEVTSPAPAFAPNLFNYADYANTPSTSSSNILSVPVIINSNTETTQPTETVILDISNNVNLVTVSNTTRTSNDTEKITIAPATIRTLEDPLEEEVLINSASAATKYFQHFSPQN